MFKLNSKNITFWLYTLMWSMIFISPILFISSEDPVKTNRLLFEWLRLSAFLIIFLVNTLWLVPYILNSGRYIWYIILCSVLIIGVSYASMQILGKRNLTIFGVEAMRPHGHNRPRDNRPPPPERRTPPPNKEFRQPPPQHGRGPSRQIHQPKSQRLANSIFIATLLVGFNNAIFLFFRWQKRDKETAEIEKEKLKTELDFLKYQISPHFFMNTLNNIHALVDIDSENAKNSIIKLSKMMRYLLYESGHKFTTLASEAEFIDSYIELMRLRFYEEKVKVTFNRPVNNAETAVPALLFVNFIENSFKHGIDLNQESFVTVKLDVIDNYVLFMVSNSKPTVSANDNSGTGGIGIENVKKRLNLIYKDNYELQITDGENEYCVNLKIPTNVTEMPGS